MENEEFLKLYGSVTVKLFGPDGKLKQSHTNHNLIVTVGKSYLTTWLAAASQAGKFMSYVGLGTSSTAAASGDTALGSELAGGSYARQVGVLSASSNTWTNTVTFSPGIGTGAVTEAGLFSAVTSGTLFAHQVFSVYNVAAGDTLVIAWSVSFS